MMTGSLWTILCLTMLVLACGQDASDATGDLYQPNCPVPRSVSMKGPAVSHPELSCLTCPQTKRMRTLPPEFNQIGEHQTLKTSFVNNHKHKVVVWEEDYDGQEKFVGSYDPGQEFQHTTIHGKVIRAYSGQGNKLLLEYMPGVKVIENLNGAILTPAIEPPAAINQQPAASYQQPAAASSQQPQAMATATATAGTVTATATATAAPTETATAYAVATAPSSQLPAANQQPQAVLPPPVQPAYAAASSQQLPAVLPPPVQPAYSADSSQQLPAVLPPPAQPAYSAASSQQLPAVLPPPVQPAYSAASSQQLRAVLPPPVQPAAAVLPPLTPPAVAVATLRPAVPPTTVPPYVAAKPARRQEVNLGFRKQGDFPQPPPAVLSQMSCGFCFFNALPVKVKVFFTGDGVHETPDTEPDPGYQWCGCTAPDSRWVVRSMTGAEIMRPSFRKVLIPHSCDLPKGSTMLLRGTTNSSAGQTNTALRQPNGPASAIAAQAHQDRADAQNLVKELDAVLSSDFGSSDAASLSLKHTSVTRKLRGKFANTGGNVIPEAV